MLSKENMKYNIHIKFKNIISLIDNLYSVQGECIHSKGEEEMRLEDSSEIYSDRNKGGCNRSTDDVTRWRECGDEREYSRDLDRFTLD